MSGSKSEDSLGADAVYGFAAEIARLAMEADPSNVSGLVGVLKRCREYFDVDILSVWRAAERGRYKLVAAILADQSSRVTPVATRSELDFERDLKGRGHIFIEDADLGREFEANLPDAGQLLIVPMGSAARFAGVVAFRSTRGRRWTDEEIAAAELVPQLIFHLVTRLRLDKERARQKALLDLVDEVRAISAGATFDTKLESDLRILDAISDALRAESVNAWAVTDHEFVLQAGSHNGGPRDDGAEPLVADHYLMETLKRDGHVFTGIERQQLGEELPYADENVSLLVATSGIDSYEIVLSVERSDGRRWTRHEVSTVRSVAGIMREMNLRVNADDVLRRRMALEALAAGIAADLVDVSLVNIDHKLDGTLKAIVGCFGLGEASIWRFEGDQALCRKLFSVSGVGGTEGVSTKLGDVSALESRGWAVVGSSKLAEMIGLDKYAEFDSQALVVVYSGPSGVLGSLVMVDSDRTLWSDDEIRVAREIAELLGHVRTRMVVARGRLRRERTDELLLDVSTRLLELTSIGDHTAIEPSLESLRVHLGLDSLAVWDRDIGSEVLGCSCEAAVPGGTNVSDLAPIEMTNPVIMELHSSSAPVLWRHLDGDDPDKAGQELTILPIYMAHDDFVFLSALQQGPGSLPSEVMGALRSVCGMLGQFYRRLGVERLSDLRRRADQVMNQILLRFIDTGVGDDINPLPEALSTVGKLLSAVSVELWEIDDDRLRAHRAEAWKRDLGPDLPEDHAPSVLLQRSDLVVWPNLKRAGVIQPEDADPTKTLVAAPLILGDELVGCLILGVDRDHIPDPELEVVEAVLDSFGALIMQMRTRIEAESTVVRKMEFDKRLNKLAAGLVRATARDTTTADEAFKTLCGPAGIDQVSLCRVHRTATTMEISFIHHAGTNGVGSLPTRFADAEYPMEDMSDLAFMPESDLSELGQVLDQWWLVSAPGPLKEALSEIAPPGDRTVAGLGRATGDTDAIYLFVSRPEHQSFDSAEVEFLMSALTILAEHDARMTVETWLFTAIDQSPIAISIRDTDMNFISCNLAYERITGRSLDELQNTDLHDVLTPDDAGTLTARQKELPDGEHISEEVRYARPDGTVAWGRIHSSPVDLPGSREPSRISYVEDITDSRRHREVLKWQATHDELTGLPNRRLFLAQAEQRLEENRDDAMIVLDLDRFKVVNDSLGHSVGDQLLVVCADRIRLSLRPGDLLCRLGGDEFAILLTTPADMATASAVADRLLSLLRESTHIGDLEVFPSASIGIAIPEAEDGIDDLLRHADSAMYQSKSAGRDCWTGFDSSMREAVLDRVRTETDLRLAIENGQLEVHYQPEVMMSSGAIVGAEALVRWRHPELGLLTAGAFIDVAEESGIVVDLGRWVLGVATRQAAEWIAQGHDITIRVNLSARQVQPGVVAEVEDALRAAGLGAERLCLELTETAIMDDVEESQAILTRLHDLGVKLAIDDFGTGFSSLAYLKRLPMDILKIDQSFVAGVGVDSDDTAIVASVIALAGTLGLDVVAEGIENSLQQRELLRLGCERGQGFHLARPAPSEDVEVLLESSRQI